MKIKIEELDDEVSLSIKKETVVIYGTEEINHSNFFVFLSCLFNHFYDNNEIAQYTNLYDIFERAV